MLEHLSPAEGSEVPIVRIGMVWVSKGVVARLRREADRTFPLETGGILMGYWAGGEAVVCEVVGPGPGAVHERYGFVPDYSFQEAEVARIYGESGGECTYLGDWHSHPEQEIAELSGKDVRTLQVIARCKEARAPIPLMAILAGEPGAWGLELWKLKRSKLLRRAKSATLLSVRVY